MEVIGTPDFEYLDEYEYFGNTVSIQTCVHIFLGVSRPYICKQNDPTLIYLGE